ncbi:TonB-dependent receptor [Mucilaginibacter sp. BJC16-A38]|uniref:SusC/RagA family TonB-linked outer membrane protein n=1 Tax=Mucilaginibacter phenanthrenivorans TaxID=1234842 RepID=UPI002157E9A8|nr:TonB-dependent receptor [Mucilaginibacter phenanthrenivorans]MCR8560034.1 TonB-dependent receptor [Mucilaginibacter phenanthrenivorans]
MNCYLQNKKIKLYLMLTGAFLAIALFANTAIANTHLNASLTSSRAEKPPVKITGTVTDEAGLPLPGVTVRIKGSTNAVATTSDGKFTISSENPNDILVFTYVSFVTQEVPINGRTEISVKLKSSNQALNEVVVVGYGSQRRAEVTGAISSVSGPTLTSLPTAGIDEALQGRVSGLSVTNNGSPGTSPLVVIRGISSISFASDPLYVVDGFPIKGGLTSFDARDVESVQVLKDASAAAIYGSRATNGVIIITTKKGTRNGKVGITFNSYVGVQSPSKYLDLLNTNQYVQYATALDGAGSLPPRLQSANFNLPIYAGASQTYAQTNTDWQRAYFKSNAILTSSNFALNGGNDVSRFYSSAGYFKQDGIAQGLSYQRINYRINSDHIINKFFTVGENLYIAGDVQHYDATGGNRTPLANVIRFQPYLPVHDPTTLGGFRGPISSFDGSDPTNPVEAALIGVNRKNTTNIMGTIYATLNFTSWLRFTSTFGGNYINGLQYNYTPIYNDGGTLNAATASIAYQRQTVFDRLYTQQLSFDRTFGKHHITAIAVYETQGAHYITDTESGNQSLNTIKTLPAGSTNVAATNINEDNYLVSYVGRATYDFGGKYLLNASIRRDGLSIWAPGHKYANFPAVSAGWNISQEDFMKDNKTISELKLRGGYGVTGVNPNSLGNYPYLSPVQLDGAFYPIGNGSIGNANSSYTNGLTNPNLNWEKTKQLNFGVDLGLLNNKITIVAEYYRRQTDNLILNVPTPPSQGFQGSGSLQNIASMRNTGIELQVGYHKTSGDFKYDITGLISGVRNKVLALQTATASLPSGSDADFGGGDAFTNTTVGQSIQYFYGWIKQGIFQNQAQIDALNAQAVAKHGAGAVYQTNAAPGDLMFKDINGDGVIDANDRTNIGSFLPKFTYSLNYNASYKNFDFAIFFQGVQGNKVLNALRIIEEGMPRLFNSDTKVLDAWTPTNTNTDMPRTVSGDPNRNGRLSTRWIENGSYLRLKNVVIGYTLPQSILGATGTSIIKRLRLYASSQNLLTITGYKGYDPEIGSKNGTLTNGVDFGQYPSARTFQMGLQAGF